MAKRTREAILNAIEIVQKITKDEYWGWTHFPSPPPPSSEEAEMLEKRRQEACVALQSARGGDITPLLGLICERLKTCEIIEAHGIIHNKDTKAVWDEWQKKEVPIPVDPHVDILLKFRKSEKRNAARTISNLAAALGLDPERLRKLGKGKDAYDDRLAYLIHIKDTDKHPYSPEEVVSIVVDGEGKSYAEYYKKRRSEWLVGRAKKNKKKAELKIDEVLGKIRAGEITKRQMLLTPELYSIYGQYKRQCNDAFNTYAERAAALTEQALENHEFKIATFFFYGETESGKSRLARECVKAISKIQGGGKWRYRKTAATNALDGYAGEEIVWMDDARGNTMKASDWLTYMDQFNISPLSARYNNVLPACRVILITSTKSPLEFFYDSREDVNQFLRRIMAMIHIHDNGNSKEYVDSIVNISRPVSCEKRMELVGSSENAPLALVSREFKGDGVDYDIGQAAEKVCELVAEASDKSLLVAEAGPPIEVVRSSDPEWYLHLPEPDETSDEDNQSPKLPLITRLAA